MFPLKWVWENLKGYLGKPANAKVCMDIDQEMFRAWFLESIGRCI